ncbi:cytochrome P450 704B1 [Selaginella moellendorffii]|uniref:cytochrome P450 704B1 n=1 Tax=Selaginella moellendorffii TaxID=88036 RepID=UPI000D1CB9A9|nr:cytochrome P450 704B1 [Selaginella moellendorffii]|eukprot:XP_002978645.2 cytochrome P450 704B1 [Selaginella moellendorffii]
MQWWTQSSSLDHRPRSSSRSFGLIIRYWSAMEINSSSSGSSSSSSGVGDKNFIQVSGIDASPSPSSSSLLMVIAHGSGSASWMISIALLLAWWVFLHRLRQRHLAGPKTWPLLGCIVEQARNFDKLHDWLLGYFNKTLTFSVPMATINNTFTANPANVEYILKTNFNNFPKGDKLCGRFEDLMGQGIFTVDGERWIHQRKVATAEFASSKLRDYSIHTFRDKALRLVKVLDSASRSGKQVDLQDLFMRLTLDSICTVGFGVGVGCLSPDLPFVPFAAAFDEAMRLIIRRYVDVFWKIKRAASIGSEARLAQCLKVVDSFLYQVINRRREEMKRLSSEARADLLSRFMVLEGEEAYTDKMLRDVVMNFMVAGRDTTALTLSWFFSELCKHPEVADKIVAEVSQVLGSKQQKIPKISDRSSSFDYGLEQEILDLAELLDYQTLNKMQYLHAALTEALRLYPAVPLDTKQVIEDDTLPDGTKVRAGQFVSYVPYSMGRLEHIWGPDATEFKPERWLNSSGVYQPQSPYKFTTFQAGPRMCLGKDSAYLQMKMTTVMLLKLFNFSLVEGQSLDYRMMAVLYIADGVQAKVTRRE